MLLAVESIFILQQSCFAITSISEEAELFSHIKSKHIDKLFPHLAYDDLRETYSFLPQAIYKCSYCGFYAESRSILDDPTSSILHHLV